MVSTCRLEDIDASTIGLGKIIQLARATDTVDLHFADAQQKQESDVERLMSYGIDLLIISPSDVEALTPVISRTYEKIPVIVLDRAMEGYDYSLFIGPDKSDWPSGRENDAGTVGGGWGFWCVCAGNEKQFFSQ